MLTSHKDNQSKYQMHVLNDDFIIRGKKLSKRVEQLDAL